MRRVYLHMYRYGSHMFSRNQSSREGFGLAEFFQSDKFGVQRPNVLHVYP